MTGNDSREFGVEFWGFSGFSGQNRRHCLKESGQWPGREAGATLGLEGRNIIFMKFYRDIFKGFQGCGPQH